MPRVSSEDAPLPAGEFATWLTGMQAALRGAADSDVPCGDCTACCTSAQFVHIEPDERATLAAIDERLLFPAPGLPDGHVVLGYDAQGRCPMLVDGACSIYPVRPRACRVYDCRLFAAIDRLPDKPDIARRVRRWRFEMADDASERLADEVRRGGRIPIPPQR